MALMHAVFDYDRYALICSDLAAVGRPPELHGHLVGRLSAGSRLDHTTWLNVAQELLDGRGSLSEAGKVALIQLYDASLTELAGSADRSGSRIRNPARQLPESCSKVPLGATSRKMQFCNINLI